MAQATDIPLAVMASRVRREEKLIFAALQRRGLPDRHVDDRTLAIELNSQRAAYRAALNRSLSHTRSLYLAQLFEAAGARVFNSSATIETCGDKIRTSLALIRAGAPTPRTIVALTPEAALQAIDELGYPVVLKPATGSWGRLLAKITNREAAEAVLEHKQTLGSPAHAVISIQEDIDKPDRDIRTIVIGDEVISAMYHSSARWITNTARGATPTRCELTDELVSLPLLAAQLRAAPAAAPLATRGI